MMSELKIKDIINQISIEAKLIFAQSQSILLRGGDGLDGNNYNAGFLVEGFVKDILRRYLPDRFEVVSGYIIDSSKNDFDRTLKQIDCIIIEKSYPIFYKFKDIDIHIVTKESVCGIIEIKRNLNNALDTSVKQIQDIIENAGISKINPEIITTHGLIKKSIMNEDAKLKEFYYFHNPIIGIISLESGYKSKEEFKNHIQKLNPINKTLDFIYSFDGLHLFTTKVIDSKKYAMPLLIRRENEISEWDCLFHTSNKISSVDSKEENILKEEILWRTLGFINAYLNALSNADKSSPIDYWEKYYFNDKMFKS